MANNPVNIAFPRHIWLKLRALREQWVQERQVAISLAEVVEELVDKAQGEGEAG